MAATARFAGEFARREQGRDDAVARQRLGFLEDFVGNDVERDLALGLADAGGQFLLRGNRSAESPPGRT